MTVSERELQDMLAATHRLSKGPAKFAALDTVFRHADAAGNLEFGFRARMNALSDFHHGGDYARTFMAFSWCLDAFDRHPGVSQSHDAHTLLWCFKWIVWELSKFPAVPLDRTVALLDDMERRYRLGSHSLHAVYQHRGLVAHHVGDPDAADYWYNQMIDARRDGLSDCAACVPSGHVQHLVSQERYAEAVEVGAPYSKGGCTEQPHWMLSELLVAYLKTGHLDDAANAHRTAYRRIRESRHHLELIALNVQFCGLTGNEDQALPIIERHLPWLDRPASPYAAMEFVSAAALVLRRLREAGRDDEVIRRRTDDGTRVWESSVAQTQVEMVDRARALAGQFDARNGNSYHSGRIERRMAADPLVTKLPLTVLAGRSIHGEKRNAQVDALVALIADSTAAGDLIAAARGRLELAYVLRNADQLADATEVAEEAQRSLDQVGRAQDALAARYLLFQLYGRGHQHQRQATALDELLAAVSLPASVPPIEDLLEQFGDRVHGQMAVARYVRAAEIHRDRGDATAEARTLCKALRKGWGTPTETSRALIDRLDALCEAGELQPAQVIEAELAISGALTAAGEPVAALDRVERVVGAQVAAGATPSDDVLLRRAKLLVEVGRAVEAEELARLLADDARSDDVWPAQILVAKSLRVQGRVDEAAAYMEEHTLDESDVDDDDFDD